jgi:TetR/AcrR family transcriptional repressor of nem operon
VVPPKDSDTRERILETAAALWHERSFDGVGVAEICAAAEVGKGSFFHFFGSKEELLLAVLDRHDRMMFEHFVTPALARDLPPLDRLRRYFEGMILEARRASACGGFKGCPIGNLASELATRNDAVRQRVQAIFDRNREAFRKTLRDAVKAGDLPKGSDVSAMAGALLTYTQGLAVLGKTYDDERMLRKWVGQVYALVGLPPRP